MSALAHGEAPGRLALPSGASLHYEVKSGATWLRFEQAGQRPLMLRLERDEAVAPRSQPTDFHLVAALSNARIVLVDAYPSARRGLSFCQAGEERFLRVLIVGQPGLREAMRLKLESCIDSIELARPGLEWDVTSSTLRIRWLLGPSGGGTGEAMVLQFGPQEVVSEPGK